VLEDHLLKLPTAKSDDDFIFPSLAQRKISPLSKQFRKIIVSSMRLAPNSATLPRIPTMLFFRSLICTASRRSTARTVSLVT
jgi:hypothetical protein